MQFYDLRINMICLLLSKVLPRDWFEYASACEFPTNWVFGFAIARQQCCIQENFDSSKVLTDLCINPTDSVRIHLNT